MTDQEQKRLFKKLVRRIRSKLESRKAGTNIRVRHASDIKIEETDTKGWYCIVGRIAGIRTNLEIWYDRFTHAKTRKVYYGFYSKNRETIKTFSRNGRKRLGAAKIILDRDVDEVDKDFHRLSQSLRASEYGKPITERYDKNRIYFYGIYAKENLTSRLIKNDKFIERIAEFFQNISLVSITAKTAGMSDKMYPKEGEKKRRSHVTRERNGQLPRERKAKDNYQCKVCGFRFEDMYGQMGIGYAEAHHTIALAKLNRKKATTIDDLVTVCSNCHSMLHYRMDGKPSDVSELRRIVFAQKRKKKK